MNTFQRIWNWLTCDQPKRTIEGTLKRVTVQSGDLLVLEYPGRLSPQARENIRVSVRDAFRQRGLDIDCLVCEESLRVTVVLGPEQAATVSRLTGQEKTPQPA